MRLLLIRHGQNPANVSGRFDTPHPGHSLTALGQAQAERLRSAMAEERELVNTGIISLDGSFEDGWSLTERTTGSARPSDSDEPLRDGTGEGLIMARSDTRA